MANFHPKSLSIFLKPLNYDIQTEYELKLNFCIQKYHLPSQMDLSSNDAFSLIKNI